MIVERDNKQSYSRSVYMDHASTTPLDPAVLDAMLPYMGGDFGNASSVHRLGRAARGAIEGSRERIAGILNANPEEIIFTSGATEANNLALNALSSDSHLVTSTVEHKAVLEPATGSGVVCGTSYISRTGSQSWGSEHRSDCRGDRRRYLPGFYHVCEQRNRCSSSH